MLYNPSYVNAIIKNFKWSVASFCLNNLCIILNPGSFFNREVKSRRTETKGGLGVDQ